jgi:hypothetical protein
LSQFFIGISVPIWNYILPSIQTRPFRELIMDGQFVSACIMILYTFGLIYLFLKFFVKTYCVKH